MCCRRVEAQHGILSMSRGAATWREGEKEKAA
jgi:hypothetical protein